MRREVEAVLFTCDGCGAEALSVLDDPEPPYGYHGNHIQVGSFGGTSGTWFACKKACLLKAIAASEDR